MDCLLCHFCQSHLWCGQWQRVDEARREICAQNCISSHACCEWPNGATNPSVIVGLGCAAVDTAAMALSASLYGGTPFLGSAMVIQVRYLKLMMHFWRAAEICLHPHNTESNTNPPFAPYTGAKAPSQVRNRPAPYASF